MLPRYSPGKPDRWVGWSTLPTGRSIAIPMPLNDSVSRNLQRAIGPHSLALVGRQYTPFIRDAAHAPGSHPVRYTANEREEIEMQEYFTGTLGIVLETLVIVWAVLLFLLPFYVYVACQRAKQVSEKMDRIIIVLDRWDAQKERATREPAGQS